MRRQTVDLAAHLNETVTRGHPADFPVGLHPIYTEQDADYLRVPHRRAVTREDTGEILAVVSDRYTLVPHQRVLDCIDRALESLDLGVVPRGIYVDPRGARLRAIFKFPALARPIRGDDTICPCLKVQNTYDGSSRIAVHIGAFRFVCTNLAVGGGGVFAGGFMSVHAGEIPLEEAAKQLTSYLERFVEIVRLYRAWWEQPLNHALLGEFLERLPHRTRGTLLQRMTQMPARTVFDAYNVATAYATHEMRSARTAFELLDRVNRGFQKYFVEPVA